MRLLTMDNENEHTMSSGRTFFTGHVPKVDFMYLPIKHEFYYGKCASGTLEIMSPCNYSAKDDTCTIYRLESDGRYYKVDA